MGLAVFLFLQYLCEAKLAAAGGDSIFTVQHESGRLSIVSSHSDQEKVQDKCMSISLSYCQLNWIFPVDVQYYKYTRRVIHFAVWATKGFFDVKGVLFTLAKQKQME